MLFYYYLIVRIGPNIFYTLFYSQFDYSRLIYLIIRIVANILFFFIHKIIII